LEEKGGWYARSLPGKGAIDSMPRVLHVQKVAGIAGSENHLLMLLPCLRERGFEPSMLVLADPEDRPEPFIQQMRSNGVPVDSILMRADVDPLLPAVLARYLRRHSFELIHSHLFHADLYCALAAHLAGRGRLVSSKHGYNPWRAKPQYGMLDRLAALKQRRIIIISHSIGNWLARVEGLPAEKMRTVHYALDAHKFRSFGDAASPCDGLARPIIGVVSRLLAQKGVHVLIQAFADCLAHGPAGSLVIVGDGPARPELEQQARVLGISGKVHFLGYVPHPALSAIIRSFDIFAFPSFGEGFGMVLLEAMAWGKPVVASDVIAIPEIVLDGVTGLLAPPHDPEKLASALVRLIKDENLRLDLGGAGQRRVETRFTVERMVRQTVEVYEEVLNDAATTNPRHANYCPP
jgi:glycosyltransferase involved in cell wall biosynthesis